ncbi:MAG: hypothetical protein M1493_13230 [Firmicutes bacterium]|nr:hypothetical protein [Bacillota bacterium]
MPKSPRKPACGFEVLKFLTHDELFERGVIIVVTKESEGGRKAMEVRKVFKAGNSFAVSIPADWVREMHLEDQPVQIMRNEQGEIVVRPMPSSGSDITPEFYQAVDRFVAEYGDVLKGLADR